MIIALSVKTIVLISMLDMYTFHYIGVMDIVLVM